MFQSGLFLNDLNKSPFLNIFLKPDIDRLFVRESCLLEIVVKEYIGIFF